MKSSIPAFSLSLSLVVTLVNLAAPASATLHIDDMQSTSLLSRDGKSAVYTRCKNEGDFALTFDDGPYKYNSEIVNELNQAGAIGTFFVNGNNYDCIYDKADELIAAFDAGHIIASHSWSHVDITTISGDQLHDDIDHIEGALKKILGIRPRLFRPPYGNYNDEALEVLKSRGYSTILWSMDSGDSTGKTVSQSEQEYKNQGRKFPQPGIGLNHETYQHTAEEIVPFAITELQKAGYKLVSVSECLGLEPYRLVEGKTNRDESWHC